MEQTKNANFVCNKYKLLLSCIKNTEDFEIMLKHSLLEDARSTEGFLGTALDQEASQYAPYFTKFHGYVRTLTGKQKEGIFRQTAVYLSEQTPISPE